MLQTENEAYAMLLCGHLRGMTERLRRLPDDLWDWIPAPPAPTSRILAAHTWQWLVCDRQHIAEPDALNHADIGNIPADPKPMCDLLESEATNWRDLILSLTPEQLDAPTKQFNTSDEDNVRGFVCHMIQTSIYKHGQFSTLFFALGLDGDEPYEAPFPNPIYKMMRDDTLIDDDE